MPDQVYLLEPTHSSKHGKFTNQFVSYANVGFSLVRAYRIFDAVPDVASARVFCLLFWSGRRSLAQFC
jgi:hypothetical protein